MTKRITPILLLWFVASSGFRLFAQDYQISFQTGPAPDSTLYAAGFFPEDGASLAQSAFQGGHYLILQFTSIPSAEELQVLSDMGVELFDYIPNYAYLAKVPVAVSLPTLNIRAAAIYEGRYKLPQGLANGDYPDHVFENGQLQLLLYPWPSVSPESLKGALEAEGFAPETPRGETIPIRIADSLLLVLAAHPGIRRIGLPEPPPEPEGVAGRSSLRLNLLSSGYSDGLDGEGVSIAIGDDGSIDHEDFRGRLFDHTYADYGEHGDMTSGLAIGAGNINPLGTGMAPGATLHLYNIQGYPHITNAIPYYQANGTLITSTSYSEGCGGAYTSSARAIDQQARQQPELLHIFSAGNYADYSCSPTYGSLIAPDGNHYGNITGGRKAAKNVMAVGNLYYNDLRVNSSSRGPAEDGRIKPDISAFGQGAFTTASDNSYQQGSGTSAAAPSVAGAAATLVQAYRQQHNGADPSSALIKASILNSAEDLGRHGPDYDYGWGRLHAGRALEVIQQGHFFYGTVASGGQNVHPVNIPGGVKEVRIMLYWIDPEGSPVAAKALVNDLDLTLTTPNGVIHHPWVLSTHPHIDSITKPAYRYVDRVNNAEQVTLENPAPGAYSVTVKGHLLGQGPQQYYVVYSFLRDEITVTYPSGGEHFVPGETESIRWDAYGNNGSFTIQYSNNGGQSWSTVSSSIPGNTRYYNWQVPALATGQARIRVLRNSQSGQSFGNFSILGVPDFQVEPGPAGEVHLSWAPVSGANQYDVFTLGQYAMEVAATTTANSIGLPAAVGQGQWYSVRARYGNQAVGRRAVAKYYTYFPCETNVFLTLHFDNYPGETRWRITSSAGDILASGGPYTSQAIGSTITVQECLPFGCFNFTIFDAYQNGMCCNFGNGYYELRDANGNLLASGGQFGSSESTPFCLSSNTPLQANISILNQASCYGGQDGAAAVLASGGSGIYTYNWSNGASTATISNLGAGSYSVTVSDGQSAVEASTIISSPPPLTLQANATPTSCSSAQDGTAFVQAGGGQYPYSYSWSNGANGQQATGLSPGAYSVTVSDQNNCSAATTVEVLNANPVTATLNTYNPTCQGAGNGYIQASVNGGTGTYSFSWSNGASGPLATGLDPGIYQVTISDENNCSTIETAILIASSPLALSLQSENASCAGSSDGLALALLSGGSGGYSFSWNNGANEPLLTGLGPGTYIVEGRDASGCTATGQVEIQEPAPVEVQVSSAPSPDGNSWSVNLSATGGTPPYLYSWQNGMAVASADNLAAGDYLITATDAEGCTGQAAFTLQAGAPEPCDARGASTSYEWIEGIRFGSFFYSSGNNGGYGDFRETDSLVIHSHAGAIHSVALIPGFNGTSFYEYWRLWIDLDQDGNFTGSGEEMLAPPISSDTIFATVTLPDSLLPGDYAVRIAMNYGSIPMPCSNFPYGEVEDYTLRVEPDTSVYCSSGAQSSASEWIEEARIGDMSNPSGNDGGYADYTDKLISVIVGAAVPFHFQQGNNGSPYPESWRVWADLNRDGDFEDSGELLHSRQGAPPSHSGQFIVPADAMPGLTRLRVSMKFGPLPGPCEPYTWGETEDYSLLVGEEEQIGNRQQ
ncbi:MAG: S8 family serine peptidase, partial [Phaeodactylibacter sp.]|nr:S8 family serine peptidase [Phaeodactylibacter sp.]